LITHHTTCTKDNNEHGKTAEVAVVAMVAVVKLRTNKNKTITQPPAQYWCPILTGAEECEEQEHDQRESMAAEKREMQQEMEEQEQAELREIQRRINEQEQAEQRRIVEQERVNMHYACHTRQGRIDAYYQ
jgi:hypothetical protein